MPSSFSPVGTPTLSIMDTLPLKRRCKVPKGNPRSLYIYKVYRDLCFKIFPEAKGGTLANFIPPRLRSNLATQAAGAWPRIVFRDLHGVPARTSLLTVPSGPRTSPVAEVLGEFESKSLQLYPPSSPTGKTGRGSPAPGPGRGRGRGRAEGRSGSRRS